MTAVAKATETSEQRATPPVVQPAWQLPVVLAIVLFFAAMVGLWHWLDNAMPAPDDSSYILGSFKYADLLRHPKFWKLDWWYGMLTVNRVYPPTVMVINGLLRLILGCGHWVNAVSVMLFNAILSTTVFGTARLLTGSWRAAAIAAVLVNLYPQTSCMNHGFALDAPLLSMVSFGIFVMFWWRSSPSLVRTLLLGLSLGAVCLSKQIAAAYLVGPGIFLFLESVAADWKYKRWHLSLHLVGAAVLTVLCGLPWLLTNLNHIKFLAQDNQQFMGKLTLAEVFPRDLMFYANSLPAIMSPLLCLTFFFSLPLIERRIQIRLFPLALSAVGGVVLLSTLTWAFPSFRYDAPATVATAIYSGYALSKLLEKRSQAGIVAVVIAAGLLQFVSFNFAPYPIATPPAVAKISERLGVNMVETIGLTARDKRETQIRHSNPQPPQDWGQEWALRTIDDFEGKKAVYLNILPDYVQLNGNTFELVGRMLGSPVRPTTSRRWTVMGDDVRFDPTVALYYQWYLLKSGYQGNLLRDDASEKNYAKLIDFVEHSGKFDLRGSHLLPDGTTLYLYRQK